MYLLLHFSEPIERWLPKIERAPYSLTLHVVQVGTIGGGTQLASQSACLNLLGVKGANMESPGANAQSLARVVAATVLAGEISLMSALAAGQLVKSHMKYNRSNSNIAALAGAPLPPLPKSVSSCKISETAN